MMGSLRRVVLGLLVVSCGSSSSTTPVAREQLATAPPEAHATHASPGMTVASIAEGAMLFDDLGAHHRTVTTTRPQAQRYFDQGLRLLYAFNHDEAARSFAKAAAVDPSCAMCFWGIAYALGPNYNVPMLPDRFATAWEALGKAKAAAPRTTPVERALIGALATRYKGPAPHPPTAQAPLNLAYADAMRDVAKQFPDDDDVQVLAAEAMMDVSPWKLWTKAGKPTSTRTGEIVTLLEGVLARAPDHPGANHYYIHAIEASPDPAKGLAAAARLPSLIPGAGHVVHMPAHIYQRVGRYADASAANRAAARIDLAYMRKTKPPGYYPMYLGHNYGFLAYSASMEGRAAESLEAARASAKAIPPEMLDMMPGMDFFVSEPLLVMVRFSRWNEILSEPRPNPKYNAMTGLWLHAHGMANASLGNHEAARVDLAELQRLIAKVPPDEQASNNPTRTLLAVSAKALEARIAESEGSPAALTSWAEAVAMEDALAYAEPADWFYSLRHFQGAALLAAGNNREAEAVYREDLVRNPHNGWALSGLVQSLRAQKKLREAAKVQEELDRAWSRSDLPRGPTPITRR